jgi:hypothetical protein
MGVLTRLALFIVGPDDEQLYIGIPSRPVQSAGARPRQLAAPPRLRSLDPVPIISPEVMVRQRLARFHAEAAQYSSDMVRLAGPPPVRDIAVKSARPRP